MAITGGHQVLAQNAFNNVINLLGSSGNAGNPDDQMVAEVLNSTSGLCITFEPEMPAQPFRPMLTFLPISK